MISETDINSEKTTIMEIAEEVEKDGTTSAEDVKSEKNVTESTFSEEEYVILKEKVNTFMILMKDMSIPKVNL